MTAKKMSRSPESNPGVFRADHLFLAAGSIGALIATFLGSNADYAFKTRTTIFILITALYLAFCVFIYRLQKRRANANFVNFDLRNSEAEFSLEDESKLLALDDANEFFGATLKPADMFRLVASRIGEMIPFEVCALAIADEEKSKLKFAYTAGASRQGFAGLEIVSNTGLAGLTFQSAKSQIENKLSADRNVISNNVLKNLNSGIAVPLFQNESCFGALILYGAGENQFASGSLRLLEAVGERMATLYSSSRAFESSLTTALIDSLTNLPNERGFFLILENQIAEAQRFRDHRLLAILTIDIRNFGELNQKHGHVVGDRILEYAAGMIKNQLRQMDFLARSTSDEFLAVLPTASEEVTREIVARIEKIFVAKPYKITGGGEIHIHLSFGAASFGKDGETANEILKRARVRKQQSKTDKKENKILWFPKEYVN